MKKLTFVPVAALLVALMAPAVMAQNDITFQVNMRVKILEGAFDPATDMVVVRGTFNGWSGTANALTDADGDSIYTGTWTIHGDTAGIVVEYKYVMVTAAGDIWESTPNRSFTTTGSPLTLPVVYFEDDEVVSLPQDITFQVNMRVKILEGAFNPVTDLVVVRGTFNGWSGVADSLLDADGDSIYTRTISILGSPGDKIEYKFVIVPAVGDDKWESTPNRIFYLTGQPEVLPVVYFEDDTIVSVYAEGYILFNVDMTAAEQLGWFDPAAGDSMQVRGGFNAWGGGDPALIKMDRVPGTKIYELLIPIAGYTGDALKYKYYIDFEDLTRWPGMADWWGWEEPATTGGGNRWVLFEGTAEQEAPLYYYNDVPPGGIIPAGDTVTVTMNVYMEPATRAPTPFNPATDTVRLFLHDNKWTTLLGRTGGVQADLIFTDPEGDMVYTLTWDIVGPVPYGIVYAIQYGTAPEEGGGFEYGRRRTRYIQPIAPGQFPRTYTCPTDTFQADPPLPIETPPLSPISAVEVVPGAPIPTDYVLEQNYPNPFNPETSIRYSVPVRSRVTIRVYNLMGQLVVTLVDKLHKPGVYLTKWDGRDRFGKRVASGVYFCTLESKDVFKTQKMLLVK